MDKDRIKAISKTTYKAIGEAITPAVTEDNPMETLEALIGVQAGLSLANKGNLYALEQTTIISKTHAVTLNVLFDEFTETLQNAIRAQLQGDAEAELRDPSQAVH